jgi:hypothetical protein
MAGANLLHLGRTGDFESKKFGARAAAGYCLAAFSIFLTDVTGGR